MARKAKSRPKKKAAAKTRRFRPGTWALRAVLAVFMAIFVLVALYRVVPPPSTPYVLSEGARLGGIQRTWVSIDDVAPVMVRSVVAAEDANFCLHWGLDVDAIRDRIDRGGSGGASTISQQTVKNVYLWHGRSWVRKAIEAVWTPLTEAIWPKHRILEVYLNIAEFDEGVFGIQAASRHYFGVNASDLSATQAARLAAILPSPKTRSASNPSSSVRRRAASIQDGALVIRNDGRADCFQ